MSLPPTDEIPESDSAAPAVTRIVLRTTLLAVSIVILFPSLLGGLTGGAWPRFIESLGTGKWIAWGACFVLMTLLRFAGGPKRNG